MRRYLAVCFLLAGSLITTACGGGNSSPPALQAPSLGSGTVLVTVIDVTTSRPLAGITVTQSLEYDDTTQQPVDVVTTQNTGTNGNTSFAVVPNVLNCFSIPITPTYGFIRVVDCSVPVPSQLTLDHV